MKLSDYESQIFDSRNRADRLLQLIRLFTSSYFEDVADESGCSTEFAFQYSYEIMQGVMSVILENAFELRKELDILVEAEGQVEIIEKHEN